MKSNPDFIVKNGNNKPRFQCYREDVEPIANLPQKHNLYLVSDEIYEKFVYYDHTHCNMASIPEMRDRTLTIKGYSKGWAMTGWRVGYGVGNKSLIERMTIISRFYIWANRQRIPEILICTGHGEGGRGDAAHRRGPGRRFSSVF